MSEILIRGVEMPTDHPMWIVVHSDGTVEANEVSQSRPVGWQTLRNAAVPVPPHGNLIDAKATRDAIISEWAKSERVYVSDYRDGIGDALGIVMRMSSIVPASE